MLDRTRHPLPDCLGAEAATAPPRDVLAELFLVRANAANLRARIAGETRAREAAEHAHRQAVVRADRAEHAERQVTADRDRWHCLALELEAELRSLQPERKH
ncbi:MAG: hypothetical protein JWQ94_543 [Tardiphaga sp.]|nr:hypothetical protein [Tardiphaga sp.]